MPSTSFTFTTNNFFLPPSAMADSDGHAKHPEEALQTSTQHRPGLEITSLSRTSSGSSQNSKDIAVFMAMIAAMLAISFQIQSLTAISSIALFVLLRVLIWTMGNYVYELHEDIHKAYSLPFKWLDCNVASYLAVFQAGIGPEPPLIGSDGDVGAESDTPPPAYSAGPAFVRKYHCIH
ncbi:hypothetical protein PG993_003922 [Apiospora rasikravindrae]|uniref:Uncharacterized protein n=1 Tax=Apiospora rasikravindrae TaxID=990691 RepID=A0ABR1U1F4_9PEZI